MANNKLAIIGGSGLYDVEEFKERELLDLNTPWGKPSDQILKTIYKNKEVSLEELIKDQHLSIINIWASWSILFTIISRSPSLSTSDNVEEVLPGRSIIESSSFSENFPEPLLINILFGPPRAVTTRSKSRSPSTSAKVDPVE